MTKKQFDDKTNILLAKNMNQEQIRSEIITSLRKLDIVKVILFGSFALGNQEPDSDIDLLVVTNDDFIPDSFEQKMKIKLKVSKELDKLRHQIPLDLIVQTKAMHTKFLLLNSMFKKEILSKGIVLYEKND
jgi:predicted nucleotidyltransferase